jgi:hypothetical protein
VDFTSSGDAWYDSVELTKIIAGDNAITEIDERLGSEFGALKQLDVRIIDVIYYLYLEKLISNFL